MTTDELAGRFCIGACKSPKPWDYFARVCALNRRLPRLTDGLSRNVKGIPRKKGETMTQDFLITDNAGVWLFEPLSEAAIRFTCVNANFDELLWRGKALVVDFRGAAALVDDLEDEGFTLVTRH
jgi:hypothetical protein